MLLPAPTATEASCDSHTPSRFSDGSNLTYTTHGRCAKRDHTREDFAIIIENTNME